MALPGSLVPAMHPLDRMDEQLRPLAEYVLGIPSRCPGKRLNSNRSGNPTPGDRVITA